MSEYRDAAFYVHLITTADPFGNEVRIERDDPAEEISMYKELHHMWASEWADTPHASAKLASLNADLLRRDRAEQAKVHTTAEVIDAFIRDKRAALRGQPMKELRSGLELFNHFMGDTPFNALTKAKLREFRDAVPRLPARIAHNVKLKTMSFPELLTVTEQNGLKRMSARTVDTKISAVRQLLKWAVETTDFIREDLSGVLKRKYVNDTDNQATSPYKAFERQHLKNLISSYLYRGEIPTRMRTMSPYRFWIPLIALYTGARLEEICQLYLQDVVEMDGVLMFRITPDDDEGVGKKVKIKTLSSHRSVPVHSRLIEFGLPEYVRELRAEGQVRLFPDLGNDNAKGKFGFDAGKWFGDTMRKTIDYEKGQGYCFHSFRKNFIQQLQNVTDVPREVRKALVGHSVGDGDVHEVYEGEYSPAVLKANIEHLKYDFLDITGVSWADYKARLSAWKGLTGR
ncbi:site-specific integrase [Marinobacterium mangrovicola]|uniref:site-specific integrase n=1 Tax=Marinobacterium mangrovicola TaxID=1476959 RepID=UPI0010531BCB|nr:site-specific integrase [Marinobacterium mangrovicola]